MGNKSLEVPRGTVAVRRFAQRNDASFSRTQVADNPLDHAVLAGCIAALKDDQYLVIAFDEVPLQLDQLNLEQVQTLLVGLFEIESGCLPDFRCFELLAISVVRPSCSSNAWLSVS